MTRAEVVFAVVSELVRFAFGLAIIGVNAYVLYLILTRTMPEVNKDLVIAIANGTGIAQGLVLGFYFGSSAGSAAKDRAKGP